MDKTAIDDSGITNQTYTTKFGGEFTVTTAATTGYLNPYARASVTGRINKENMHRVTVNGTEYILRTRLWMVIQDNKVYEYLGNLGLFIDDISGVPGGTDNVPFVIISDINNSNSIDILTNTSGTYTIKVEQINVTQKTLPKSLIWENAYVPIEKNNNGGTYNGFSMGVNELNNKRGTFAIGYWNKIEHEMAHAFGNKNHLTSAGVAIGYGNTISGSDGVAIGYYANANAASMVAVGKGNYPAITEFPNFQPNTFYKKGDIVRGRWVSQIATTFTMYSLTEHISGNVSYLHDDLDPETGNSYWTLCSSDGDTCFVVGNGLSNGYHNALKINTAGTAMFGGDVYVNCDGDSSGGTRLATIDEALPTVTGADDGKFLRVVSGAWAAATVPSAEGASF